MKISKTLYVTNRVAWRRWLTKEGKREKEIWLIYYKKSSGNPRIPYNDAVEEALCFGWIDSTVKAIDEERFAQRFTPRKPTSILSRMNRERVRKLIDEKRMTQTGLDAIAHAFDPGENENFTIAKDIIAAIKKDRLAWMNFQQLPERYKRIRIDYIERLRCHRKEAFWNSLRYFIKMTAKNKRFGLITE
ncbi:YdeI/OmpD-associated family protein [Candidatus Micrarchaeota archaeon]|nr:YdeI/OmpD-associated family protein [Candidatus Micrarchaeota archaeon]